jgi:polysaccharide biosynthesis transport protein
MEIRQYINMFKRWIWLLILVAILGVGAGYAYSRYETPVYHSATTVLILKGQQQNNVPDYLFSNDQQITQTISQMILTQPVVSATSQRLGYPIDSTKVQVDQVPNSDLITVGVDDTSPQRAADIANTMVTVFVEQNKAVQASRFASSEESLQAQIQDVDTKIANLQKQLTQQSEDIYKSQVDDVSKTIANLQNEITTLQQDVVRLDYVVNPPALKIPGRFYYGPTPTVEQQLELTQKQDRLNELKTLLGMYQRIYVDLTNNQNTNNGQNPNNRNLDQIQAALTQYQQIYSNLVSNLEAIRLARMSSTTNIVQVEAALPASIPVRPKPVIDMAIGGILGLLVAGAFAFISEYLDDTLRSPEEVAEILQVPVLGYIGDMDRPKLRDNKQRRNLPYVLAQPRSPVTEAFRSLRANLEFVDLGDNDHIRSLVVTSSSLSEGKTTIATNLAIVMSQMGRKVVLIDADLRRPRVHKALGISNVMGLSDVLRNHATISEVAQPWGNTNLMVVTSGSLPPNPAEVLSSDRMVTVMNDMKNIADMVIIDSPPSLLADAAVLAARADGVLLVIQSNKTQMNQAMAMTEQLKRVGAHVVGVALNRINSHETYYYYSDLKKYTSYAYDVEKTQPKISNKKL